MTQEQIFAYVLVIGVALIVVYALQLCYQALSRATTWSLTDALSEEVTLTQLDATGNPVIAPAVAGAPPAPPVEVTITTLKASSSRFIALLGTISILLLYIGFGLASLDKFVVADRIPDMSAVTSFFYAGLVLFAPYIVNKFSSAFSFFK